jgi:hypothetical protein
MGAARDPLILLRPTRQLAVAAQRPKPYSPEGHRQLAEQKTHLPSPLISGQAPGRWLDLPHIGSGKVRCRR